MDRVTLRFAGDRHCPVLVGAGAVGALDQVWHADWERPVIIGDQQVVALHAAPLVEQLTHLATQPVVLDFPPGELHKSRATKSELEDRLLASRCGRHCCIVALGGGISLDLAGFVAATYLRGVPHINVPTSLLAQVDAAIGGKTGVNTAHGKNLIGAFHQPAAVLVDSDLLATLPAAEWPNGLAELVKHAMVADAALFEWIESHAAQLARPGSLPAHPLLRCVEIKAAIVAADEREHGRRAILNFGHTIGHAIERASDHAVPHGMAVAVGMQVEARLAVGHCGLAPSTAKRLVRLCARLGLDQHCSLSFERLRPALALDKKRQGRRLRFALPRDIAAMATSEGRHTVPIELEALREVWTEHHLH